MSRHCSKYIPLLIFVLNACGQQSAVPTAIYTPAIVAVPRPTATSMPGSREFNGAVALKYVEMQVALGPRYPGTAGNRALGDAILAHLDKFGWETHVQEFEYRGTRVRNVWGVKGKGEITIVGAHYDTRKFADQDAIDKFKPVPGANDGASGTAVLMELAETLDFSKIDKQVWLAFFDAEDNGDIEGWDWIVGSTRFAASLTVSPTAVVVLDMVGDAQQDIFIERSSDAQLTAKIWGVAKQLGYEEAIRPLPKWNMIDDHTPFLQRGFRAVDMIDFDYPHWHTLQDTLDKIAPSSLERVGRTIKRWLEMR